MHSCMETTSFGTVREIVIFFLTQSKLLPQDKNFVVYLLLLSNSSQEILSDIASPFSDFTPTSLKKKISLNFIRTNMLRTLRGENNDYVLLSTI